MGKSLIGRDGDQHDSPPAGAMRTTAGAYTPLQLLYLERLTRLVHKLHLHGRYLATTDRRMQLLNRAVLATFQSCRDLALEGEARAILAGLQRTFYLPAPTASDTPPTVTESGQRAASGQQLG